MNDALNIYRMVTNFISLIPVTNFIVKNESLPISDFERFLRRLIARECSGFIETAKESQFIRFNWQRLSDAYDTTTDSEYGWLVSINYGGGDETCWKMPLNVAKLMVNCK